MVVDTFLSAKIIKTTFLISKLVDLIIFIAISP